jgi:cobalt/nickel transport system permease protein
VEAQYLDHYSYLDSPIHRIAVHFKMAAAIALVFLILLIPISWWWFHTGVFLLLIVLTLASRVPLVAVLRRMAWVWIGLLVLSLTRLAQPDPVYGFLSTLIHASLCLLTMTLLANTTRFTDILQVLRAVGTPRLLVTTLGLMYRYLFVLSDESHRMRRARQSRTFKKSKRFTWHTQASVISHLFVRCVDRAQRIHSAMSARSFSDQ